MNVKKQPFLTARKKIVKFFLTIGLYYDSTNIILEKSSKGRC